MKQENINGGYVLLERRLLESLLWTKPPVYLKVWIYLLLQAQHKDYKNLKRGQLYTSARDIAENCAHYVGYRKEKPSISQINRALKWLRNNNETNTNVDERDSYITSTKATKGSLISLNKYAFYQNPSNYRSNNENNPSENTNSTREDGDGHNINKNDNNVKKDKDIINKAMEDQSFQYLSEVFLKMNYSSKLTHKTILELINRGIETFPQQYALRQLARMENNHLDIELFASEFAEGIEKLKYERDTSFYYDWTSLD